MYKNILYLNQMHMVGAVGSEGSQTDWFECLVPQFCSFGLKVEAAPDR